MQLTIYADLLFILNFVIDLILLCAVNIIKRQHARWYRLAGAAAVGALCACLFAINGLELPLLKFLIGYLLCTVILVLFAFGYHCLRDLIINAGLLFVIALMLGGLMEAVLSIVNQNKSVMGYRVDRLSGRIPFLLILALSIVLTPVIVRIFYLQRRLKQEQELLYEVTIVIGEHTISCRGLMDTGNNLYEPISKDPVIIVDRNLLIEEFKEQSKSKPASFCVIPFSSIGKEHGILYGIRPDRVTIHDTKKEYTSCRTVCALSEHDFKRRGYHAILHTELLND